MRPQYQSAVPRIEESRILCSSCALRFTQSVDAARAGLQSKLRADAGYRSRDAMRFTVGWLASDAIAAEFRPFTAELEQRPDVRSPGPISGAEP